MYEWINSIEHQSEHTYTIRVHKIGSLVDQQFAHRFDGAAELYNDDKLEECIELLPEMLDDGACPRFFRIKILVLLGGVVGDWYEAVKYCEEAEALWRLVRRWAPKGNATVGEALAEVRESIDELQGALQDEAPQPCDDEDTVSGIIADTDTEVPGQRAEHETELGTRSGWKWSWRGGIKKGPKVLIRSWRTRRRLSRKRRCGYFQDHMPTPPTRNLRTGLTPGYVPIIHRTPKNSERTEEILRKPSWRRDN
ncbi:hypothetical protein LTR95_003153 [Oleoguttula sp. CCFEE 5521]